MSTIWTREELLRSDRLLEGRVQGGVHGQVVHGAGPHLDPVRPCPEIRQQLVYLQGELAALDTGRRGPTIVLARVRR